MIAINSKVFLALAVALALVKLSDAEAEKRPPFCDYCECERRGATYDVVCKETEMNRDIFNENNWLVVNTNEEDGTNTTEMYPYHKITVEFSHIPNLDQQFPKSDITLLNLANNSIVNISNNVFSNLANLEVLVLSHNSIETIHPRAFYGQYTEGDVYPLRSLKVLRLDFNKIHSLDADIFEHTDRVQILSISNNPLQVIDPHTEMALTSLPDLKELDLSYTQIATLPSSFMHTPKVLMVLDLSGNSFEALPDTLGRAHSLEILYLNNNPIPSLSSENGFMRIPTLKTLHMRQMKKMFNITDGALAKLENLEELVISDSILEHISQNALSSRKNGSGYETWPPITKLRLNDNKLTHIDMHLLRSWADLVDLDLTENPWTCECENQWMLDELLPIYMHLNEKATKSLRCAAPIEMVDYTLYNIFEEEKTMRCLDYFGHRPERDGTLLIGIFAGILITVPIILFILYSYNKHWFGIFDNSPAAFSRQFYSRTGSTPDDF